MSFVAEPAPRYAAEAGSPLQSTQQQFQNLSNLLPQPSDQPLLFPYDINALAAGIVLTVNSEAGVPDKWIVSIRPGAGIRVSVFNGPQASGTPYRLGGGGKLKLPAVNEYLTVVVEAGSNAASGTIVAIRKYSEFDIDPGELA